MNYPTRTWRKLDNSYYRMKVLNYHDSNIDFNNLLYAVSPAGGLIATAFKPNEYILITGKATSEELMKKRREI